MTIRTPFGGTLRSAEDLARAGLVTEEARPGLDAVAARYAVAITPAMADLIEPDLPDDPIARQFVPDAAELDTAPEEMADPIGDIAHSPVAGIVHRYPDRVLLKPLHVCPVYCRFCFRREMVGPEGMGNLGPEEMDAALAYIAGQPNIWEVVVTGGDPLILSSRRIGELLARLAAIPQVKVVRFHSRVPVVDPGRVTGELTAALRAGGRLAVYVVLHANHARELTVEARAACARLVDAGVPMLSQSVLLRGVNDSAEALEDLLRVLVETRIKPYYLHHPDLAPGTGHFRVSIAQGQALMRALRGRVSGLCQPTYVLDLPGGHGKSPLGPSYATPLEGEPGRHLVEDYDGQVHRYPPEAAPEG
ncbi:lysine-2,3-aminomutase-like protein [Rubellimicrobium arenae]|uniref:lysine-2,3-aminomutase-like protein n=1 Tax=Rubellimicrobium arenae TaxID=2817372 RepID=UPI001B30B337|nr:lysine-2,3-aminomutase-like protein [Rubellimicrobium arenae]